MSRIIALVTLALACGCAGAQPGAIRAEVEQRIVIIDGHLVTERHPMRAARLRLVEKALWDSRNALRSGYTALAEQHLQLARDLMGSVR